MGPQIQEGHLVLADISGYTSFLADNELDHAPAIMRNILTLLLERLTPTLKLAEVEGDAVFVYAPAGSLSRPELLLELIEDTYSAFRDTQRTMHHNATCPCSACRSISQLDLKFVAHYGRYVLQHITGAQKPVGTCVNLAHRLLKNGVAEATGWRGYALFTEQSLAQMDMTLEGLHETAERYEHLGVVRTGSLNLDERYRELVARRRVELAPEDAHLTLTFDFPAPPPVVWDWLNDPHKRNAWAANGADWEVFSRPRGRTGTESQNHCRNSDFVEHILDWRPFDYSTVRLCRGKIDILISDRLEPFEGGTRVRRSMRLQGSLPRWMLRPLMKLLARRGMRVEEGFRTLDRLIVESRDRETALA